MNIESVPNITTVDTATAVLYGLACIAPSQPSTAAAPQMALPVEVRSAMERSILSNLPTIRPITIVPATIIASMIMADNPTAVTS